MAARRRHDRDVAGAGRPRRPVQGQRRPPSPGASRAAPPSSTARRSAPSARSAASSRSTRAATTHRAGRVVVAADAWTNELLAPFGRRLPLTITKEQVTYFARPGPGGVRPGPLPGLDLDGRPVASTASRPTARPGPKAAQDCGGQPTTPETRTFERDEAAHRARRATSWPRTCPAPSGPEIYTKTCLYTLTPGPGLRRRPAARGARASRSSSGAAHGFKYASVLGRVARRSSPSTATTPSAPDLERFRIDRPILLEAAPGDVLDGLDARGACVACRCRPACATVTATSKR